MWELWFAFASLALHGSSSEAVFLLQNSMFIFACSLRHSGGAGASRPRSTHGGARCARHVALLLRAIRHEHMGTPAHAGVRRAARGRVPAAEPGDPWCQRLEQHHGPCAPDNGQWLEREWHERSLGAHSLGTHVQPRDHSRSRVLQGDVRNVRRPWLLTQDRRPQECEARTCSIV